MLKRLIFLFFIFSSCSAPTKQMLKSKNFNGKVFTYQNNSIDKSFLDLMKWKLFDNDTPWPKHIPVNQVKIEQNRVTDSTHITFINHSTFLIQHKSVNILTDPIWSERTSPVSFIGPKRIRMPAVKFEDLPPIDIVLVGHNHYDHLDIETLIKLDRQHSPTFIVGLGVDILLKENGIKNIVALDWDQNFKKNGINYTFVACKHWSARGLFDRNETLWGSYIIRGDKQIYFASDTGYSDHFKDQYKKYGPMDISLLPIGAYEPRWFMKDQHMNPEESIIAHLDLGSKMSIGMHFGTFKLTNEGVNQHTVDLHKAVEKYKIENNKFIIPEFGQLFKVE